MIQMSDRWHLEMLIPSFRPSSGFASEEMPKRNATGILNHDNWNDEDEPEERGYFAAADKEVLKSRPVKIARRRTSEDNRGTGGLFKSFSGFTSGGIGGDASAGTAPSFSFNNDNKRSLSNQLKTLPAATPSSTFNKVDNKPADNSPGNCSTRDQHLSNLKALNSGVVKWLQEHIARDPYCVLSPVFADYERHLMEIEKRFPFEESRTALAATVVVEPIVASAQAAEVNRSAPVTQSPRNGSEKPFSFIGKSTPFSFTSTTSSVLPSIGAKPVAAPLAPNTGFSFLSDAKKTFSFTSSSAAEPLSQPAVPAFPGFSSFKGAAASSSNSSIFQASSQPVTGTDDDEEYVPPKPEVKQIQEDDSVFTTRCKLFYKSGDQWKDKGIGNLHIKPIDNGKFQLLIRADTNLGNILLNICVTKDIPCKLQKNNVALVCVPSPPINTKEADSTTPVPMLVRVKTEDAAANLLAKMNENRGIPATD